MKVVVYVVRLGLVGFLVTQLNVMASDKTKTNSADVTFTNSAGEKITGRFLTADDNRDFDKQLKVQLETWFSPTNMNEPVLAKLLPGSYATFQQVVAHKRHDADEAKAALNLMRETRELLLKSSDSDKNQARVTYQASWQLCLRVFKGATDPATKNMILTNWDKHLGDADEVAASQIHALANVWDRSLMTETLWRRFNETSGHPIIAAVAYAIYRHGDASDGEVLTKKLKTEISTKSKSYIQNSLNWLDFRLRDVSGALGPSHIAPHPEW